MIDESSQSDKESGELASLRSRIQELRKDIWEALPSDPGNDTRFDRRLRALLIKDSANHN